MNDITRKWDKTGLLDKLTDTQKDECSAILNDVAAILIKNNPPENGPDCEAKKSKHEQLCGYILPMVRVGYELLLPLKFPDVKIFMKDFQEFFDSNLDYIFDRDIPNGRNLFSEEYEKHFIKKFMKLNLVKEE